MIALSPQRLWLRVAPSQRPLLCLALFLFSLSGLVSGLALRPLIVTGSPPLHHGDAATAKLGTIPNSVATATIAQATAVTMVPERFSVQLIASALSVHAGQTLTITVQTKLLRDSALPARGVLCMLTLQNTSLTATQTTDASGTTLWTVVIPTDLASGTYNAEVTAHWGAFAASFGQVNIAVE